MSVSALPRPAGLRGDLQLHLPCRDGVQLLQVQQRDRLPLQLLVQRQWEGQVHYGAVVDGETADDTWGRQGVNNGLLRTGNEMGATDRDTTGWNETV